MQSPLVFAPCTFFYKEPSMSDTLRLNIGGGDTPLKGFETVDRRVGKQAFPLEYDNESVDEIRASHVLEHFPSAQVVEVLQNWVDKLKPGGTIRIAVPDFEFIARMMTSDSIEHRNRAYGYAYGGQIDENDFHHAGFDHERLRAFMQYCGLRRIRRWKSDVNDCAALQVSLNLEGMKPLKHCLPVIEAVMSTSRLGFTENMFCALSVFPQRNVDITKHTGAWWHHCLDRIMTPIVDGGPDGWILVLDYDTVFDVQIFDELCYLMADHPHVDALAPWQMKRESDHSFGWVESKEEIKIPDSDDLIKVDTAHFGLTLLRTDKLRELKRPWFKDIPDDKGEWGDKSTDPDIYFWKNWKECGNSLYMANHVSIGHCQQMVTWPDYHLKPIHQYLPEFQKTGMPKGVRQ